MYKFTNAKLFPQELESKYAYKTFIILSVDSEVSEKH